MRFYEGKALPYRQISSICYAAGMVLVLIGSTAVMIGAFLVISEMLAGGK